MASAKKAKSTRTKTARVSLDDRTVLDVLDQIAGKKRLGQQREPKWFHPFPARMPLAVAKHLVRKLTKSTAVIADPMAGSGTTLVAARQLGRGAIGNDRDILAVRIARCATHAFTQTGLDRIREKVITRARKLLVAGDMRLPHVRGQLPDEDQQFIRFWFPIQSQRQLFALAAAIDELKARADREFAWVVFSSLIIAKSSGASHALDIARSRPHKRLDKPVVAPFDVWDQRFRSAVSRLPFLNKPDSCSVEVHHGDARALSLEDACVDFVLTSPPYRNAIDYMRCHKFALVWMGHPLADLRELRGTMIGTERGLWSLDGIPAPLEERLQRSDTERQAALVRQYLSDMRKLLTEIQRILKPKGLAALVVGPTMINSRRSDAAEVFGQLAEAAGLRLVGSTTRLLDVTRRSLPVPQQAGRQNDLAKRMTREVVLILRKD